MKKHLKLTSLAVLLLMGSSQAFAFDWFGGRLSIGGGYGRAKPKLPYVYQDRYQDGEMWTGHLKYFLNNDVSIVASYADLQPYRRGNKGDHYDFKPVVASLRYNVFHHLPFTPYVTAGAGYSFNRHEVPNSPTRNWKDFTYQGGLGLEFFITEGTSVGVEALYHHFNGGESSISPYRLVSAVGTVNIYFGKGPSSKRAEEAAKRDRDAAAKALAEAEAAKQQALQAQQQAQSATQGQQAALAAQQQAQAAQASAQDAASQAQKDAAAANEKLAAMQAQSQQAQAELDNIKQMVARKDIAPITFKTGSADLLATSNPTLNKVAEAIKKYPNLKLRVEGHTDNQGGDAYNVKLSQARADAVKTYLTGEAGVPADQITATGVGKAGPVADNGTAEGRAQNRRVEFITYIQ